MTPHALLFTLACIGISETVYLIKKRRQEEAPACFVGQDCHVVLTSKYNKLLGIHNDLLGLVFYVIVAIVTALLVLEFQPFEFLDLFIKATIFVGSLMSLYFTFLQWQVIKAWCFWCVMSAMTVCFMAAIVAVSSLRL